ncbi:HAD-IIIA family hydrolase, partial [Patescibacteria group bacterium]|nr:HAD-IIIA family hydrolase [Patescibacteria group bacterium]
IKQAVIFAGGIGERLRPLTNDRPKPMVLVNGRPFLEYLIELLKQNGITEVLILLGYLPDKVQEHFGDGAEFGIKINYHIGRVEDETGTRLKNAEHLLDDQFLLMYGDNYWPMDLAKMVDMYNKMGVLGSTTVYGNRDDGAEYGAENNICVSNEGYVLKYDKSRQDTDLNGVDIGFFLMDKKVLDLSSSNNFSFEQEILPQLASTGQLAGFRTDHPYYWMTTPNSVKIMEKFLNPKKIIFLDRDGVINKQMLPHDYVKQWSEFEFLPGTIEALSLLSEARYKIFIITNQRGISRGLITEEGLVDIHSKMINKFSKQGIVIEGIYCCPHGDDDNCDCRKPKPGLLFRTAREHFIDLSKTIFIGNSESDIKAGEIAGCKTLLVDSNNDLLQVVKSMLLK